MSSLLGIAFKGLLFFLTFAIEIRVHASSPRDESPKKAEVSVSVGSILQEPSSCFVEKTYPCAVKNRLRKPLALEWNGMSLGLGRNSSLVLQQDGSLRLIFGDFVLQTQSDLMLKSEFTDIELRVIRSQNPMAMAFFQKNWRDVRAVTVKGEIVLKPLGREEMIITRGFETRVSTVSSRGRAGIEIPAPFHFKSLLKALSPYFSDRGKFKKEMAEVQKAWSTSVTSSGDWYLSLIDRQIASARDEEERKKLARENLRKENEELRQLFRRRNFFQ